MKSYTRLAIVIFILSIFFTVSYSNDSENQTILILNSYDSENVWTRSQMDGILDALDLSGHDYNLYIEYMDAKRFDDDAHKKQLFNYLHNKYDNQKIDYIVATDDSAFSFLNKNVREIFGESKVVFSGLNYLYEMDRTIFTGVYEKVDIKSNIDFALKLFPDTENIYVIGEEQTTTRAIALEVNEYLENSSKINVEVVLDKNVELLKDSIEIFPSKSIVLFTIFNLDHEGNRYTYADGFHKVMSNSDIPIFSFWSFYDGLPIIGGYVSDAYLSGQEAGQMLVDMLEGKSPNQINISESKKVYKVNYKTLEKYNVSNFKFDNDVIYINRPISFLEKNKDILIVFIFVLILLIIIIVLLYRNNLYSKENIRVLIENKKIQDQINNNLEIEVEKRIKEYGELQKQIIESEKMAALGSLVAGISHEINTPVGIAVTGTSYIQKELYLLKDKLEKGEMKKSDLELFLSNASEMNITISQSLDHAAELINSFKRVAVDQSSSSKREFELKTHIEEIILSINYQIRKNNIELSFKSKSEIMCYGDPGNLFQILTNLINNSIIHAFDDEDDSKKIEISLWENPKNILISYSDNGSGIEKNIVSKIFDPFFTTKRGKGGSGLGLNIVYNIVTQSLNGSISCESKFGEGSKFIIEIPHCESESEVENG